MAGTSCPAGEGFLPRAFGRSLNIACFTPRRRRPNSLSCTVLDYSDFGNSRRGQLSVARLRALARSSLIAAAAGLYQGSSPTLVQVRSTCYVAEVLTGPSQPGCRVVIPSRRLFSCAVEIRPRRTASNERRAANSPQNANADVRAT